MSAEHGRSARQHESPHAPRGLGAGPHCSALLQRGREHPGATKARGTPPTPGGRAGPGQEGEVTAAFWVSQRTRQLLRGGEHRPLLLPERPPQSYLLFLKHVMESILGSYFLYELFS